MGRGESLKTSKKRQEEEEYKVKVAENLEGNRSDLGPGGGCHRLKYGSVGQG